MGLFGRGRRERDNVDEPFEDDLDRGENDEAGPGESGAWAADGPYDESEAPDDDLGRLDLGSILLPVPDGAQLQVEMEQEGAVRAVHVLTPHGQLTINAYAAPRTGGLWDEVSAELSEQLRTDGASVRTARGEWGTELLAALGDVSLRFIGVDGPRWMLRGVVAGPPESADAAGAALVDLVRGTVVVRGTQPMPVRTPLPIDLPEAIASHIAQAQEE